MINDHMKKSVYNRDFSNLAKFIKLKDIPIANNWKHLKIGVRVFTIVNQRLY